MEAGNAADRKCEILILSLDKRVRSSTLLGRRTKGIAADRKCEILSLVKRVSSSTLGEGQKRAGFGKFVGF